LSGQVLSGNLKREFLGIPYLEVATCQNSFTHIIKNLKYKKTPFIPEESL